MDIEVRFDDNGYVIPYDIVSLDWIEFTDAFGTTDRRRELLADYRYLTSELAGLLPIEYRHWIGSSFVTTKPKPNDIDVVVFVPFQYFPQLTGELKQLRENLAGRVDCYFVEAFPETNRKYAIGRSDELTWYSFLRRDRRNRKKGIVELLIGK